MDINTNQIVSISEANQNFSRVARAADRLGTVVIFKNNEPDKTGKVAAGFRVAVWVLDNGKPRK